MNESVILTLILGSISGFGLLSICISFFEKDFEEIEYIEDERPEIKTSIHDELDITTYDFYTDEL
jgi:hypothetical protein